MIDPNILEFIIENMAMESGKHIDIIINELARHYGIEEKSIVECLKEINSPYMDDTNRIVGFIDGQPIKRTTYHMACKRIFEKLRKGFDENDAFNVEDWTENDRISFLTESMYSYLKEGKNADQRKEM